MDGKKYCVYFIKVCDAKNVPTKIGYTNDIGRRLVEVQTHNPDKIKLDCTIPCESKEQAQKLERFLHRQLYKRCHISGEWFNLKGVHIPPILHKFYTAHKSMFPDAEPLKLYSGKELEYSKILSENLKLKLTVQDLEDQVKNLKEVNSELEAELDCLKGVVEDSEFLYNFK